MEIIKNFLRNKTLAFYIAVCVAGISVVAAILYAAAFSDLSKYMSWLAFAFLLLAPVAFLALSFFGLARIGAAALALLDFAALLFAANKVFGFIADYAMVGFDSAGSAFPLFVAGAALMVVCSIVANVAAWSRLQKTQQAVVK